MLASKTCSLLTSLPLFFRTTALLEGYLNYLPRLSLLEPPLFRRGAQTSIYYSEGKNVYKGPSCLNFVDGQVRISQSVCMS